jgi:hypothetical protein
MLDEVVKVADTVKSGPPDARLLKIVCDKVGSEYTTLLLHTEIRSEFSSFI